MGLGIVAREIRLRHRMSMYGFARLVKCTPSAICQIEQEKFTPSLELWKAIAKAGGLPRLSRSAFGRRRSYRPTLSMKTTST